jgi:two-component system NtrC family sensor kinase
VAWNFRPGIRLEIVFTLTVLMAGTMALVGILFLKFEEHNLLQQKAASGRQLVLSAQRLLQDLDPGEIEGWGGRTPPGHLQRMAFLFTQSQAFVRFSIVDRQFRIMADSQPEQVGRGLRDAELERAVNTGRIFAHGPTEGESVSLMKKTPLLISAPLVIGGRTVGALRGELPLDDLREILSRSQTLFFFYIVLNATVFIVVGSFLLSRVIVKPLGKLVQMSEKIGEGNLDASPEPSRGDEVARLFSSFNQMAARLREDREKMQEYIHSLERVNRELRRAQNEVIRSEKLASIGRLAAGVAHEVGNPTGAILGYLDLLAKGGMTEEEEKEIFQRAGKEAERIRRIIRDLLDFARPSSEKEEEVDVNGVIQSSLSLLYHQRKIWETITVETDFAPDLPKWKGDPHQLQQVMINLFLNAADALLSVEMDRMPRKRKLRIGTRSQTPEEAEDFMAAQTKRRKEDLPGVDYSLLRSREASIHLLPSETRSVIRIDVEDNGPGIPREIIGKIFDPFFSTKPPKEGTGLGLAICLRLLDLYRGRIFVQSEVGRGTTFTVLLPVLPTLHVKDRRKPLELRGGGEREEKAERVVPESDEATAEKREEEK